MALSVCIESGCPTLTDNRRCLEHRRHAERARGTKAERGYDAAFQREAKQWRNKVRAGHAVTCWRCHQPITEPSDLHLGHDDADRRVIRGPEHKRCNLSAAGRASHGLLPLGRTTEAGTTPARWGGLSVVRGPINLNGGT